MASTWGSVTASLVAGEDLNYDTSYWVMDQIMTGAAGEPRLAAFLVLLAAKEQTVPEIRGLADSMQEHALTIDVPTDVLDIVGTGGDQASTVNISTMAALVIAAAGIPVVKHGNRASTSASGSADVMESLGINLAADKEQVAQVFHKIGITFCFANLFHPSMRFAAPVRRTLEIPTVFNILGPLTNPAHPRASAIGVYNRKAAPLIAGVLAERGSEALVFRGMERGLDELTTTEVSEVWEANNGNVTQTTFDAVKELGMEPAELSQLRGGTAEENAQVARRILEGELGPVRDAVLLNAAAGIVAYGRNSGVKVSDGSLAERMAAGVEIAAQTIDQGKAREILRRWVSLSDS